MSKMVGLSRAIKQEWLDKTVELISQIKNEQEIKEKLDEYLSFEIKSPTNLRKTREILLNIWFRSSVTSATIWNEAVTALEKDTANRLAINWSMILFSYPVFFDVCDLIGKINMMQDTFTTSWLKEKLLSIWGGRTTLYHSTDKILQTLKNLGAIENVKMGTYRICKYQLTDNDTLKVMLMVLLALNKKAYYEVPELSRIPMFFPFDYDVTLEWLQNKKGLHIGNFGGKIVISAEE